MAVHFFEFGSPETLHFYKWVTESGLVNVGAMIDKAFVEALRDGPADEDNEPFDEGDDFHYEYQCALADLLEDLLHETVPEVAFGGGPCIGEIWDAPESLWVPILACGISEIDFQVVAEALLICAEKWPSAKENQLAAV